MEYEERKFVSPPGPVLAKMIWIKILLRELERKWYPQICIQFILPPFFWQPLPRFTFAWGYTINFLPLSMFGANFPLNDWCPDTLAIPSSTELSLGSPKRNLPTMLSTWAPAVLDAPPRWSKRDSVLSAAGKQGCCRGKYIQVII